MIEIIKCNPLYFPNGNEYGETWQPYWLAIEDGVKGYGRTIEDAKNDLLKEKAK